MSDKTKQPNIGAEELDDTRLDSVTGGTAALPPKTTSFAESGKKADSPLSGGTLGFAESGKKGDSLD
ncbi:MAG: hypothetical protein HEQ22_04730 [Sphingopyxis sp.]|uniref:hypothetical protein n=1 Tax=Sphingopyxis sp. TaxID=1908224 RepID=UPI003D80D79F